MPLNIKCSCVYCQFVWRAEFFSATAPEQVIVKSFIDVDDLGDEFHPIIEFMFAMDEYSTVDVDALPTVWQ